MADGVWRGAYVIDRRRPKVGSHRFERVNVIPRPLLDFFSSLAGRQASGAAVAFSVPVIEERGDSGGPVHLDEYSVHAGGQVPAEVAQIAPDGQMVELEWRGKDERQSLYFDGQHQLVWQRGPEGIELMMITKEELLQRFPQAGERLQRFFGADDGSGDNVL